MASKLIQLPQLDWDRDNEQTSFLEWKEFMQSYFVINNVDDKIKYHYILLSAGTKGRELVQSAKLSDPDKRDPRVVWSVFENFLVGKPNKWVQRIELQQHYQESDETTETFVLRLRNKTAKCSFRDENIQNDRILEQLIKGCKFQEVRRRLLEKGDQLVLDTAIRLLRSHEASVRDVTEYSTAAKKYTETIRKPAELDIVRAKKFQCNNCGLQHQPRQCPAFGTTCKICQKQNHWAKVCRSSFEQQAIHKRETEHTERRYKKPTFKQKSKVYNLIAGSETESEDEFNIDTVSATKQPTRDEKRRNLHPYTH